MYADQYISWALLLILTCILKTIPWLWARLLNDNAGFFFTLIYQAINSPLITPTEKSQALMIPDQPALGSKNTSIYKEKRACWHAVYTYTKQNWCRETHRGRHLTGKQAVCAGKLLPQSIPDCLVGLSLSLYLSLCFCRRKTKDEQPEWTEKTPAPLLCMGNTHTDTKRERQEDRSRQVEKHADRRQKRKTRPQLLFTYEDSTQQCCMRKYPHSCVSQGGYYERKCIDCFLLGS